MIDRFKKLPKFARIVTITALMLIVIFAAATIVYLLLTYANIMTLFGLSTLFIACMLSTIVDEEMFEDDE